MNDENLNLSEMIEVISEIVENGGEVSILASGKSMEPFIRDKKDKITLTKAPQELKKNDIPLYKRTNGQIVLHRVVAKEKNGYVMRGDSQWAQEHGVTSSEVRAVLKSVEKNGKIYFKNSLYTRLYELFLPVIRWVYRLKNSLLIRIKRLKEIEK